MNKLPLLLHFGLLHLFSRIKVSGHILPPFFGYLLIIPVYSCVHFPMGHPFLGFLRPEHDLVSFHLTLQSCLAGNGKKNSIADDKQII